LLLHCPTCAAALPPEILWSGDEPRCPHCDAVIEVAEAVPDALVPEQLAMFPDPPEPTPPARPDLALEEAIAALERSARASMAELIEEPFVGDAALGEDTLRLLDDLGVDPPSDEAPIEDVEHALAAARQELERIRKELP
jgi:hypothetical protein